MLNKAKLKKKNPTHSFKHIFAFWSIFAIAVVIVLEGLGEGCDRAKNCRLVGKDHPNRNKVTRKKTTEEPRNHDSQV